MNIFTWIHSHKLVAIICMSPNLARAPCRASSRSLLFKNMKCIWAVTRRSRALGVIALNGPADAISAPICNPVNTNEPAPKPMAPKRKQKLPYCWPCCRDVFVLFLLYLFTLLPFIEYDFYFTLFKQWSVYRLRIEHPAIFITVGALNVVSQHFFFVHKLLFE